MQGWGRGGRPGVPGTNAHGLALAQLLGLPGADRGAGGTLGGAQGQGAEHAWGDSGAGQGQGQGQGGGEGRLTSF